MGNISIGLKQAISEIIAGIVFTIMADAMVKSGTIPAYAFLLFNIILNLVFLMALPSWGVLYTLGWVLGAFFLSQSGILSFGDILLNIIAPFAILVIRVITFLKQQI
jgi:hypothetical protein